MKTHCYKVILLGDSGVGKTTLFKKLKQKTKDSHAQLEERKPSFFDSLDITPCTLEFTLEESSRILVSAPLCVRAATSACAFMQHRGEHHYIVWTCSYISACLEKHDIDAG